MKAKAKLLASLKIWMIIYPSITAFLFLFGELLASLPLYQRTFILTVLLVPWITYIGVPMLNFVIGRLSKKENSGNY